MKFNRTTEEPFFNKVDIELKRAERYRIFISMIIFDISFVNTLCDDNQEQVIENILNLVKKNIRAIDNVSLVENSKLALLFPETTRQGAEIASKRLSNIIKENLEQLNTAKIDQVIPLEMASYPDAAGAKSIADMLKEYSDNNLN